MSGEHADHRTPREPEAPHRTLADREDEGSAPAGGDESTSPADRPLHVERIRAASRRAGETFGHLSLYTESVYPHGTHPALVPGIGVDEQRRRYTLDWLIFAVAGLATAAFVVVGRPRAGAGRGSHR